MVNLAKCTFFISKNFIRKRDSEGQNLKKMFNLKKVLGKVHSLQAALQRSKLLFHNLGYERSNLV